MRYIIETTDKGNEQNVWNTLNSLQDKSLIKIVEKGDPVEEMKLRLRKIARQMEILGEIGMSTELMAIYLHDKTKIAKRDIKKVLDQQKEFFDTVGVKIK